MKRTITFLLLLSSLVFGQNAWINEFHYENTGGSDENEFIEVAIENSNLYDLSKMRVSFYTESGSRYGNYLYLDNFNIGSTQNNITLFYLSVDGIQNGPNDGIALAYNGNLIQFVSYEGILSASEGDAKNSTSIDIGISESNQTPIGASLGLTGQGINYNSFTWITFNSATPGQPNENQALPVELTTFSALVVDKNVKLNWETSTEINNYGFDIERKSEFGNWNKLAFVQGNGNSNSPKFYSFKDNSIKESGKYFYRLKQIDIDGKFDYSDEVEICFAPPQKYELLQNYPNPFNPVTKITYSIPDNILFQNQKVTLKIYNVLGQLVNVLVDEIKQPGIYEIEFDGSKFISGVYFYKLETGDFTQMKKMILTK